MSYHKSKGGVPHGRGQVWEKMIAVNREVRHEYFVIEALETGIELVGTEVKSLRAGGVNLKDSWADIDDGELIAKGIHISPYEQGNIFNTPAPSAAFAGTQGGDPPSGAADQAAGLHAGAALFTLKGARQAGTGPMQGQEAV